jgi:tetratricopeptide (TPR) repeat protein
MNPTGLNSPPLVRRFPLSSLLLVCSLVVFFACFLYMRVQEMHYEGIIQAGSAALTKKNVARARSLFDTFLRKNPTDALGYIAISDVCAGFDQPALAVEYAQRGLEACKNASNAQRAEIYVHLSRAQALLEPAHPQTKAIASARIALSLDPENRALKNAVGYMLTDNDQNLDEAEKLLREALESLKPSGDDPVSDMQRPLIEDSYGWLLYKKSDFARAVVELNQAIQDMPSGEAGFAAKGYYYHLGAAYRKAGQIDDARRALDVALQYDSAFPEAKAEEALLPPPNTPAAVPAPVPTPPSVSSSPAPSSTPGLKL